MNNTYTWPHFGEAPKDEQTLLEEARIEAVEKGLVEGRNRAFREAETELNKMRQNLKGAMQTLERTQFRITQEQIRKLAMVNYEICRLLLGVELKTNPCVFENLLQRGVEMIGASESPIRVLVNPADQHWLQEHAFDNLTMIVDEAQSPGTISIENDARSLEYDPFDNLAEIFSDALVGQIELCESESEGP